MYYQLRLTDLEYRKTPFYIAGWNKLFVEKKADLTLANIFVVAKLDRKIRQERQ